ncbi:MAG: hypothetical protein JXB49_35000 [Bacteroidales bacterium]|nr:hypothetical protein [Bacteroidales bacterium]
MKNLFSLSVILALIFCVLFSSCEKKNYLYLPDYTRCKFKYNDTLLYFGGELSDTFLVTFAMGGFRSIDNRTYIEEYIFTTYEVSDTCSDTIPYSCEGYHFAWGAYSESVLLQFRNIDTKLEFSDQSDTNTYRLGNKTVPDVFYFEGENKNIKPEDISKLYYTYKYGIIAYELFTGELYKMDERYIE